MRFRLPASQLACVVLFATLCALIAGWALTLSAPRTALAPTPTSTQDAGPLQLDRVAQWFGRAANTPAPAPAGTPQIVVTGVLATAGSGVALLAVDGRPARPYAVREAVAQGVIVTQVLPERVEITHPGGVLSLPAPARPALDILTRGPSPDTPSRPEPDITRPAAPLGPNPTTLAPPALLNAGQANDRQD